MSSEPFQRHYFVRADESFRLQNGLGAPITKKAIELAIADKRIPFVTFLMPPLRKKLGALVRLGATFVDELEHGGAKFRKYRLNTA